MIHQIRIYSGLILLLFVTLHLSNLSLGLFSIETMNAARVVTIEPWRTLPGTVILGGALLVHAALAFWSLFRRHNLRLKAWEATQMILGFLMPLIMFSHVFAARGMLELKDVKFDYALEFLALFVFLPEFTFLQALGLLVVWTHGCIGFHTWLRLKSWYATFQTYFFAFSLLLPAVALSAYFSMGLRIMELAKEQEWVKSVVVNARYKAEYTDWAFGVTYWFSGSWIALIALVLIAGRSAMGF
ncbi:MAG: hypothetical protein CMM10_06775 [Rhodospirillaceae bacterium]|jgi:adenylate cyclase|nr:hypothetical protein [Rhodospirillaceae bacterium]MDP6645630.1 hypothetical protein [Rhodospirillales bacterium]|tara:strand:+ start:692 stop:1420 length:729 start_codon:yes stop_codon:yes gene_type:complete